MSTSPGQENLRPHFAEVQRRHGENQVEQGSLLGIPSVTSQKPDIAGQASKPTASHFLCLHSYHARRWQAEQTLPPREIWVQPKPSGRVWCLASLPKGHRAVGSLFSTPLGRWDEKADRWTIQSGEDRGWMLILTILTTGSRARTRGSAPEEKSPEELRC